jgi:hypothetical protein
MRVRSLTVAIVVVLMGMVLAIPAQAYPAMPPGVQGPFTVIKVVDGDTILGRQRWSCEDPHDRSGHAGTRRRRVGGCCWTVRQLPPIALELGPAVVGAPRWGAAQRHNVSGEREVLAQP